MSRKASSDRATLDHLLDTVHIGHFAIVADDAHPVVLPTAVVRDGDRVLAHGSTGSRWLRRLAADDAACLAVTAFDALVVARSAFESSMRYRSAVLFGQCQAITEPDAKRRALEVITDALIPGRSAEVRASTARELAAVLVLALPISEWSLKVSEGWPDDPPGDVARPGLGRRAARGAALRSAAGRAGSARWHTTARLRGAPAHQLIALARQAQVEDAADPVGRRPTRLGCAVDPAPHSQDLPGGHARTELALLRATAMPAESTPSRAKSAGRSLAFRKSGYVW